MQVFRFTPRSVLPRFTLPSHGIYFRKYLLCRQCVAGLSLPLRRPHTLGLCHCGVPFAPPPRPGSHFGKRWTNSDAPSILAPPSFTLTSDDRVPLPPRQQFEPAGQSPPGLAMTRTCQPVTIRAGQGLRLGTAS